MLQPAKETLKAASPGRCWSRNWLPSRATGRGCRALGDAWPAAGTAAPPVRAQDAAEAAHPEDPLPRGNPSEQAEIASVAAPGALLPLPFRARGFVW